jgi:predicted RNA-binding Zn-ribbon protein involved in translation (DUF1610 family)
MSDVFVCTSCAEGHSLEELREIEMSEVTSSFACPDCGGRNFTKMPEEHYNEE